MKKQLIYFTFITILGLNPFMNNAQSIIYDFESKEFIYPVSKINSGDTVELIVQNINPFVYIINHEKSTTIKNPVPTNIFSLVAGDFAATLSGFSNEKSQNPLQIFETLAMMGADTVEPQNLPLCISKNTVTELINTLETFNLMISLYSNIVFTIKNKDLTYNNLKLAFTDLDDDGNLNNIKYLQDTYENLKELYAKAIDELETKQCIKNEAFEKLNSILGKIITKDSEASIQNLEVIKRSARRVLKDAQNNENKLTLYLSKFQVKGDELNITLDIMPRDDMKSFGILAQGEKVSQTFKLNRHFKISFSPGFIVTTGLNNEKYNALANQVNDTIVKYTIIKEDESKINYGLSTLVHYTWNMKNGAIGFNTGFGYLPKDKKISGLLGITAIIGEKQKFIINGGVAGSYADTLSDSLDTNTEYSSVPTIKTKQKFKIGFWFGIAYRL